MPLSLPALFFFFLAFKSFRRRQYTRKHMTEQARQQMTKTRITMARLVSLASSAPPPWIFSPVPLEPPLFRPTEHHLNPVTFELAAEDFQPSSQAQSQIVVEMRVPWLHSQVFVSLPVIKVLTLLYLSVELAASKGPVRLTDCRSWHVLVARSSSVEQFW